MSNIIPECVPQQPSPEFSALVREKRDSSIGYLLAYAHKSLHREFGLKLHKHGVSVAQWAILLVLWETDSLTQKELSERVAVETPTVSRTIDRMERDGLVTRVRSSADRRHIHVVLTERGAGLWRDLVPVAEANQDLALAGISADEEEVLRQLLNRIIANINDHKE